MRCSARRSPTGSRKCLGCNVDEDTWRAQGSGRALGCGPLGTSLAWHTYHDLIRATIVVPLDFVRKPRFKSFERYLKGKSQVSADQPRNITTAKSKKQGKTTHEVPADAVPATCPLLERFRKNPKNDWKIKDVAKLCEQVGVLCTPPSHGSHYKLSSPHCDWILTIPQHRPIKSPYIKKLVSFVEQHLKASVMENKNV